MHEKKNKKNVKLSFHKKRYILTNNDLKYTFLQNY